MRHPLLRTVLLVLVLLASGGGLAWLWFDADGNIKNSQWARPPAVAAVVPTVSIKEPVGMGLDEATLSLTIERPLFATDRKVPPPPAPPTPPPPPPPPPPPDALNGAHLFGLIAGEQGFVILRAEGKIRSVKLNDNVGDWVLKNIEERTAQFERKEEKRTLTLEYAKLGVPVNAAAAAPLLGTNAAQSGAAAPNLPNGANAELEARRKRREAMRALPSQ
ncbi:hypothetical protein [Limnohabitans sp. 2KL-51]|uniref:hypothetical protein n=1 Tax=Limnohabitans sp. 2KL-51 TaxID=1977911 RepID=UPI000D37138F|nr:hypothetical protein [Limnohabitans sp. 2KL-51]PUE49749.1 hypothetical protein B9Z49_07355 [Limnohabitans sp. 2KL-51]